MALLGAIRRSLRHCSQHSRCPMLLLLQCWPLLVQLFRGLWSDRLRCMPVASWTYQNVLVNLGIPTSTYHPHLQPQTFYITCLYEEATFKRVLVGQGNLNTGDCRACAALVLLVLIGIGAAPCMSARRHPLFGWACILNRM